MQNEYAGFTPPTAEAPRHPLPHISYRAFSYPGDQEALERVKRIPGMRATLNWLIDNALEEYYYVGNLYNHTKVSTANYPALHEIVKDCARILDCPQPETYIRYSPMYNAYTYGVDRTFVVLHSQLVDDFTEAELRFIIGHELGHIKAGHVLYRSVAEFILQFMPVLNNLVPINIGLLYMPLVLALYEWYRRAEFTSDRAGLLCVQDRRAAQGALGRLAGKLQKDGDDHNLEALHEQIAEVREVKNKFARAAVFLSNVDRSHPYPILRIKELQTWLDTGEYDRILAGQYEKDEDGEHELGRRIPCPACGTRVNSKFDKCTRCGGQMWPDPDPEPDLAKSNGAAAQPLPPPSPAATTPASAKAEEAMRQAILESLALGEITVDEAIKRLGSGF